MQISWVRPLLAPHPHVPVWRDSAHARVGAPLDATRVVTQGDYDWWMCDGAMLGPSGLKMLGDYNATVRAGIEDDGFRASTPALLSGRLKLV